MTNKQRIWIITELFYPDELATSYYLTNIANEMSTKYEVHVVCGPIFKKSTALTLCDNITLHRINIANFSKDHAVSRLFRFIILTLFMSLRTIIGCRKKDKVMMVTNPAPLILTVPIIKFIRKSEVIILAQDIFPENTLPANLINSKESRFYRFAKNAFDRAYAHADKIIVMGQDMEDVVQKKIRPYSSNATIRVIPNWADFDEITQQPFPTSRPQIELQYAGNLGRVQGLIPLIQTFGQVHNPNIHLSIWGNGAIQDDIQHFLHEHHIENVSFCGPYSRIQQTDVIGSCHLTIITLAAGMYGLGVPSKSYNIMAAGRPILFIGPSNSEIAQEVVQNNIGFAFSNEDKVGLLSFLNHLQFDMMPQLEEMGMRARTLAEKKYAKAVILQQYIDFV